MKLMTKSKLMKELIAKSLFHPDGTLDKSDVELLFNKKIRYDLGKYDKRIKGDYIKKGHPIWVVIRTDHAVLYCINDIMLSNDEMVIYNKICEIWCK